MTITEPIVRPPVSGGMNVPQGAALSVCAVLGTGVIALPVPLAATFAALGARYPDSGGVSTYVRTAFGPRAAAVVGWSFYFAVPVGALPAAMFGGAYVSAAFGGGRGTTLGTAALLVL